jgi:hypothetical protein
MPCEVPFHDRPLCWPDQRGSLHRDSLILELSPLRLFRGMIATPHCPFSQDGPKPSLFPQLLCASQTG